MNDSWLRDPYVKKWLSGIEASTVKGYVKRFHRWLLFIKMTPTQQIEKRVKDLQSNDTRIRSFFEDKLVEYKNKLETINVPLFKSTTTPQQYIKPTPQKLSFWDKLLGRKTTICDGGEQTEEYECYLCGSEISEEESNRNEGMCDRCAMTFGADGECFEE